MLQVAEEFLAKDCYDDISGSLLVCLFKFILGRLHVLVSVIDYHIHVRFNSNVKHAVLLLFCILAKRREDVAQVVLLIHLQKSDLCHV